jgi:hypothetical protein
VEQRHRGAAPIPQRLAQGRVQGRHHARQAVDALQPCPQLLDAVGDLALVVAAELDHE